MLIKIDSSVATEAAKGNKQALSILMDIKFAQTRRHKHIVHGNMRTIKEISENSWLDESTKAFYKAVFSELAFVGSMMQHIKQRCIVTFADTTQRMPDTIIINPATHAGFHFEDDIVMLAENSDDAVYYEIFAKFYKRKNPDFDKLNIPYKPMTGGGDTTVKEYKDQAVRAESFCLCILDSDKKSDSPTESLGETCKKVIKEDGNQKQPFNCFYYVLQQVREVENLIPWRLIVNENNYKHQQIIEKGINFEKSYFDFKYGLKYSDIRTEVYREYWTRVLSAYPSITKEVEDADAKRKSCSNTEEFKFRYGRTQILEGFGEKLLDFMQSHHKSDLEHISDAELTSSQQYEWQMIGRLFFEWCCQYDYKKIAI